MGGFLGSRLICMALLDPSSTPYPTSHSLDSMEIINLTPQPYQKRILAALEDGSRLETWQKRWNRERNKSSERFNNAIKRITDGSTIDLDKLENAIKRTTDSLLAFGRAWSKTLASISPLLSKAMQEQWQLERGPTIGRKRRTRRARGRRRGKA
jgi:hypothetical protein